MEELSTELVWSIWGVLALAVLVCGFLGAPLLVWTAIAAGILWIIQPPLWAWIAAGVVALVMNVRPIRRVLITSIVFKIMKGVMPQISDTERTALKAGDVWVEGDLFSGKPDLKKMLNQPYFSLSAEEKAFIDGPVEKLCDMLDDYKIWQDKDLPPEVWEFMKKERFWGMGIPKEYGGLQFSASAHSEVLAKISSRSLPACITVMVPNSLGPAELLVHYGTPEQKKHYLPRLARGEEIPCFGLTEPGAGSDAASIQSSGVVFKGSDGKLYVRLNWNKRWITLAAVSTVIGLAFRLKDPENLLGKGEDAGITCALIPTKTPGVVANRRHDPLGVPFFNCPTQGKDVVVPIDAIIGGVEGAGQGWRMLMECLAAGRGISLPAQTGGGGKFVARVASAHAITRKQFGISIGKFEGVQEPLARIGGWMYLLEGARKYTLGGIDRGGKPPVITAIAKYNFTELGRRLASDGMDIVGGAGISRGPKNLLAHGYIAAPIAITVEGANILTRTLIVFGQGALRAHPYAFTEVDAVEKGDLATFDKAFWAHVGYIIRNVFRAKLLFLTRGRLAVSPVGGPTARYWKKLAWSSATFSLMTDIAMGTLGGSLKFKEKLTGRFADALSWMYLATGALKRWEVDGRRAEDLPFLRWSLDYAFHEIALAFDGIFANFDAPGIGWVFRGPVRWLMRLNTLGHLPSDRLGGEVAELMMKPGEQRNRLFGDIYMPKNANEPFAKLEQAFQLVVASDAAASKVKRAIRKKKLTKKPAAELYKDALAQGIITQDEYSSIEKAEGIRTQVIQVDDFGLEEYKGARPSSSGFASSPPAAV